MGSLRRTPSGRSNFSSPRQHALNPMSQKPQAVYPCGVGPGSATDFGGEKVNCLSADRAAIRQNQENPAARIGTAGPSPRIGRSFHSLRRGQPVWAQAEPRTGCPRDQNLRRHLGIRARSVVRIPLEGAYFIATRILTTSLVYICLAARDLIQLGFCEFNQCAGLFVCHCFLRVALPLPTLLPADPCSWDGSSSGEVEQAIFAAQER
jgi:hypothetical protein